MPGKELCLLGLTVLYISHVGAVNYVFDEFLFSKDTWNSWKLDNPLEDLNPSDLLPRAKEKYANYDQGEFNSLDGPRSRLRAGRKPAGVGLASDVEALDDENMIGHAAKAAQCMTCHVLATVVWVRLTNDILGGEDVTRGLARSHLEDACEKDAVDAMLRKYTILKMEGGGGGAGGGSSLTFVVVRDRRDGSRGAAATDAEEAAVTLACQNLVKESGDDLVTEMVDQLANFRREAIRLLVKYDRDGGNTPDEPPPAPSPPSAAPSSPSSPSAAATAGSGSSGLLPRLDGGGGRGDDDDDDDYVDPDDLDDAGEPRPGAVGAQKAAAAAAGGKAAAPQGKAAAPAAASPMRVVRGLAFKMQPGEPECADLNPRCAGWAASGECKSNPAYMIGTDKHRGHCRKSCGVCSPGDVLASAPALAAELEQLAGALLLAVKNLGCGASGACLTGVSGMAMGSGLLQQRQQQQAAAAATGQQQGQGQLPPGMKVFSGGFVLGKPWWGVPEIQPVRGGAEPPRKPGSPPDSAAAAAAGSSSAPSHAEVDRVLAPALANKLLSIPSDFFVYEYLYKNHTRHYHPEADGSITEDWLLGKFTRESVSLMSSATGEVAGLEELDLLPGSPHTETFQAHTWPYVKQVYAGGDECVLAGGRRVVRRVEARIACSPDFHTYMLVREPDFCTYTFVVFVPQLCELEYYRPRVKPGAVLGGGGGQQAAGRPLGGRSGRDDAGDPYEGGLGEV